LAIELWISPGLIISAESGGSGNHFHVARFAAGRHHGRSLRLKPAVPTVEHVWPDTVKRGEMLIEVRGNGTPGA
jgi:hypothetical protein